MRKLMHATLIALLFGATHAHAGLWSMSNAVVSRGATTTIQVSFTGDGRAIDAMARIMLPRSEYSFSVKPRNSGFCAISTVSTEPSVVVLPEIPMQNAPKPATPVVYCEISITRRNQPFVFHTGWIFGAQDVLCVDRTFQEYACDIDLGYVTVI